MAFKKLVVTFFLFLSCINIAEAEEFKVIKESSGSFSLITFKLDSGAKIYWKHPGEAGLATKFEFNGSTNLKAAEVLWPTPSLHNDHDVSSYVYEGEVSFPIKIFPKDASKPVDLKLQIDFTICSKSCSNHKLQLDSVINPDVHLSQNIVAALNKIPYISNHIIIQKVEQNIIDKKNWLSFYLTSNQEIKDPLVFIDLPEYAYFDPAKYVFKEIKKENEYEYLLKIPFSLNKNNDSIDRAYFNLVTDEIGSIEYSYINNESNNHSLLLVLLYALIGGFILNFMPCVLPILALKMLQIAKLSGKEAKFIKHDMIAQALGVIVSFITVAFVTYFLKQVGSQVGFGIHFQQPIYIITMTLILSIIAMNLLSKNEFHMPIPHFITKHISLKERGVIGFFFTGILSTLLAIPCTAPFVTIAVGFAITTELYNMLLIFTCLGVGMASPYIILAISPKLMRLFPKPGAWMNKFKKILGIVIFGTSLWMIYIIYSQLGIRVALSLFLLIILLKFVITEKFFKKSFKIIIAVILVSLCYEIPYLLNEERSQKQALAGDVWQEYKPNEINALIKEGGVVVLDVTASWCPTCKVNKFTTLNNMLVMNFMKKNNIIGMRADISANSTPQIFTLMQKHSHYGIPLNIIYSKNNPEGIVLPTILLPNILISAVKKADPRLTD